MPLSRHNKVLGDIGEKLAIKYLQKLGYQIIDTNFNVNRFCELDIIALNPSKILTFVEVKTRINSPSNIRYSGFESITPKKIKNLKLGVNIYFSTNNITEDTQAQVDLIIININKNFITKELAEISSNLDLLIQNCSINHIENFELI